MSKNTVDIPKISLSNTKKEMMEVYKTLVESLKKQAETELRPEAVQKKPSLPVTNRS